MPLSSHIYRIKRLFRLHQENSLFDVGGSCIFPTKDYKNPNYLLALLNSKLSFYILDSLNPTMNTQVGDLQRIPFVQPPHLLEDNISGLASENVAIKKQLNSFRIIETNYDQNPILAYVETAIKDRLISYLNFENAQLVKVLLNEAVVNQLIFKVYELNDEDRQQVETKMGKPVGELQVLDIARKSYLTETKFEQEIVKTHIENLEAIEFEEQQIQAIKTEFCSIYQSNNDLEEFCIRHQVNPINVWYWFKGSKVLPQAHAAEIALEFLADAFRIILMEDEDGIVPLVGLPGEPRLMDGLEQYCFQQGLSSA